jgi:hypothetical protein
LKLAIRDALSETHATLNTISRLYAQLDAWDKRSVEQLKGASSEVREALRAVERELINVDVKKPRPGLNRLKEKLDALGGMIDESDHRPTRAAHEFFAELQAQLRIHRSRLDEIVQAEVDRFNTQVRDINLPALAP